MTVSIDSEKWGNRNSSNGPRVQFRIATFPVKKNRFQLKNAPEDSILDNDNHSEMSALVDRWCALWQDNDSPPDLKAFVAGQPNGLATDRLLELLLIDQKYQWQTSPGPRVEEYLQSFPQVQDRRENIFDLVYGEIRARRKLGFPNETDHFRSRFPAIGDLLTKQLELAEWLVDDAPGVQGPQEPSTADLQWGSQDGLQGIGQYELIEPIARTAMSVVFKARHRSLQRLVALKMMRPEHRSSDDSVQRFKNEMLAVAQLDHPHIMPILDVGESDGSLYFTTRLVEQGTLTENLSRFRGKPQTTAKLVHDIALAIHHAHLRGILHRDIKPSNILIESDNQPLVVDFGVARLVNESSDLTQTGDVLGTPVWLAPEQAARNPEPATIAGDVYGLGTLLYFALTGLPPFKGKNLLDTLSQVKDCDPDRPSKLDDQVSRDLEMICLMAMDKDPGRRYATAECLALDLSAFLKGRAMAARPLPWWEQQRRWIIRNPLIATTVGLLFFAAMLWTVTTTLYASRERELNSRLDSLVSDVLASKEESKRHEAETLLNRNLTDRLRMEQSKLLYAAHIRQAGIAQENGDVRLVHDMLARELPDPNSPDLRGIEWNWLWANNHARLIHSVDKLQSPQTVRYSTNGKWLAVGDSKGRLTIYDADTKQHENAWSTPHQSIHCLEFSPSSQAILTAGNESFLNVWKMDLQLASTRIDLAGSSAWVAQFIDETRILACNRIDQLVVIDFHDDSVVVPVGDLPQRMFAIAASPKTNQFAMLGPGGIEIRDGSSFERCGMIELETAATGEGVLQFSPEGNYIAVAIGKGRMFVYSLDELKTPHLVLSRKVLDEIVDIEFSPDEKRLVVSTSTGGIYLSKLIDELPAELPEDRVITHFQAHQSRANSVSFSNTGKELASVGNDGRLNVWWPAAVNPPQPLFGNVFVNQSVADLVFSPDGKWLVAGDELGCQIRDAGTGAFLRTIGDDGSCCDRVAISADGNYVATGDSATGTISFWNLSQGLRLWTVDQSGCDQLIFAPDGRWIATVEQQKGQIVILDSNNGREVVGLPASICQSAAFSPDSAALAATVGNEIHIWYTADWRLKQRLTGHRESTATVTYSPDGHWIASAGKDRSIRIWNANTGKETSRLLGHRDDVHYLAFCPDNLSLVSTSADGSIKIWHVATGEFLMDLWIDPSNLPSQLSFCPSGERLGVRFETGQVMIFQFTAIEAGTLN